MNTETNADPQVSDDPLLTEARAIEAQQAQPAEPEAQEPEEDPGDEPAASDEAQPEGDTTPKRKPSVQERIDEVTRARRQAERDADYWRNEALKSREPQPTQPQQQAAPESDEPNPENYTYGEGDAQFIRDLARYETRREFAEQARIQQVQQAAQAIEQTWEQRQQDFAKAAPDYFEAIDGEWICSETMADAIRTSDEGAAVAYHLAKNPTEAHRIAGLPPLAQVRELGKLEGRLSAQRAPEPSPPIKLVSDAPSPTPQVRGSGGKFKPSADTSDFASFEKAYSGG